MLLLVIIVIIKIMQLRWKIWIKMLTLITTTMIMIMTWIILIIKHNHSNNLSIDNVFQSNLIIQIKRILSRIRIANASLPVTQFPSNDCRCPVNPNHRMKAIPSFRHVPGTKREIQLKVHCLIIIFFFICAIFDQMAAM